MNRAPSNRILALALLAAALPAMTGAADRDRSASHPSSGAVRESDENLIYPVTMLRAEPREMTREARDVLDYGAFLAPAYDPQPFRPTMDPAEYDRLKAAAASPVRLAAGAQVAAPASTAPQSPTTPTLKNVNFNGINQVSACGNCRPADSHGAVGHTQYVQVVNNAMVVYGKLPPAGSTVVPTLYTTTLASLFAYNTQPLIHPRVI